MAEVILERSLEMVADVPTMDSLRERYGTYDGWGMAAGKVEVLVVVSGLDVGRSAEA
jgi:hypothetical protein